MLDLIGLHRAQVLNKTEITDLPKKFLRIREIGYT